MVATGPPKKKRTCTGRRLVKITARTGCSTCKIRKVKCDEGWPACKRCVSTGRVCDGYRIWGGGGNEYGHRAPASTTATTTVTVRAACTPAAPAPWASACASILAEGNGEQQYFEWFALRTAKKIPGIFISSFWDKLVFQAGLEKPAVLHAILTLSAVHKRDISKGGNVQGEHQATSLQEAFMLQHYIRAIRHLDASSDNKASIQTTLVTCVIFVCLEFLRGCFRTANLHLQNGVRVLRETGISSHVDRATLQISRPTSLEDDWILEAFSRLQFQVNLLRYTYTCPCAIPPIFNTVAPRFASHSLTTAWQTLERILNATFYLAEGVHHASHHDSDRSALLTQQQTLRSELDEWARLYPLPPLDAEDLSRQRFLHTLLQAYHAMVTVMVSTALHPNKDEEYDKHMTQFTRIVTLLATLTKYKPTLSQPSFTDGGFDKGGWVADISRSGIDIGWLPPLYFTALKCRVSNIRREALHLIESASHREGIWDSKIAAVVAWRVVTIEEGLSSSGPSVKAETQAEAKEAFEYAGVAGEMRKENRIHRLQVRVPNGTDEPLAMRFWQRRPNASLAGEDTWQWVERTEAFDEGKGWIAMP